VCQNTNRIRAYDPATRTVPVTFSHRGQIHRRAVNAVLDDAGAYDQKDAAGFIKLNALRMRIAAKRGR